MTKRQEVTAAVLVTSDICSKKYVTDGANKILFCPILTLANGDRIAHIAVYYLVLERISEVASTGNCAILAGVVKNTRASFNSHSHAPHTVSSSPAAVHFHGEWC
jgi:hypothetical protein